MGLLIVCIVTVVVLWLLVVRYRKNWYKGLEASIHFSTDHAEAGQTVYLREEIKNMGSLSLPYIHVKFEMNKGLLFPKEAKKDPESDKRYRNDLFSLLSHQKVVRKIPVSCLRRGYYKIDQIQMISTGFLMNDLLACVINQNTELLVYPEKVDFEQLLPHSRSLYGDLIMPKRLFEDPFEFSGIREYQIYDSPAKINWKATAKAGTLQVNQQDESTNRRIQIILNLKTDGPLGQERLHELGISIAAYLCWTYLNAGFSVGLISNGRDILTHESVLCEMDAGEVQLEKINRSLARIDLDKEMEQIEELMDWLVQQADSQCTYILISATESKEISSHFCNLYQNGQDGFFIHTFMNGNQEQAGIVDLV